MTESEILNLMSELGALHRGHFLLSSGLHSDTYFQCARILQFPELARQLGALLPERGSLLDEMLIERSGDLIFEHLRPYEYGKELQDL